MIVVKIQVNDLNEVTIQADDPKEVIRQSSFFGSLPQVCPVDGMPWMFSSRMTSTGDEYFELTSTGPVPYRSTLGQHKQGGTLYYKDEWDLYDPGSGTNTVYWKDGKSVSKPVSRRDDFHTANSVKAGKASKEQIGSIQEAAKVACKNPDAAIAQSLRSRGVGSLFDLTEDQASEMLATLHQRIAKLQSEMLEEKEPPPEEGAEIFDLPE